MDGVPSHVADLVGPLIRVRQVRDFLERAVTPSKLDALADVARWSGSSANGQPWRFVVLRDRATIKRVADAAMPQARALLTAPAAIAIVLPDQPGQGVTNAYDEGRASERILIAASLLGLGAGISWILPDKRDAIRGILGLPEGRFTRTIVAVGHPSEAAKRPKSVPGTARLPRSEVVFEERWPKAEG